MAKNRVRTINEVKVREIRKSSDLSKYTDYELHLADMWIKNYALDELYQKMTAMSIPEELSTYISLMVRRHYGSMETDIFLMLFQCYPKWILPPQPKVKTTCDPGL